MSGQTTDVTSSEPSDHECCVCSELFTEPKLLQCFHLLCRKCLIGVLESQPEAQCPICRHPIKRSAKASQGYGWAGVADGFPTDMVMVELVEVERLKKKYRKCRMCETEASTALCLTCGDSFCEKCKNFHVKQLVTQFHTLRELDSMTHDQLASHRPMPCSMHQDKLSELFCGTHEVSLCSTCAATRHRQCAGVIDLKVKAKECYNRLGEYLNVLTAVESKLNLDLVCLEERVQETNKKKSAALDEMKVVCDGLKVAIDARYTHIQKATESAILDVTKSFQVEKECCLQRRGTVTSQIRAVQRTTQAKSPGTVIPMTSVLMKSLENIDFSSFIRTKDKAMVSVSIAIDADLVKLVEEQVAQLGLVKTPATAAKSSPGKDLSKEKSLTTTHNISADVRKGFSFHDKRGRRICFSKDKQTAEFLKDDPDRGGGVVMGYHPLTVRCLYQVKIDESGVLDRSSLTFPVGVVTQEPDTVSVSDWASDMSPAVVILTSSVLVNGKDDNSIKIGSGLKTMPRGSRVGVMIDDRRSLHLYINGVDQGVAATNIPDCCYPFFQLGCLYKQITSLPVKRL